MLNRLILFIILSFIMNLSFSDPLYPPKKDSNRNTIELGAYNLRQNNQGEYLVDIYASNNEPIAGIQFEIIGEDFKVLDVTGGRAHNSGFTFYIGSKKGIILGFSMKGKTISIVNDNYKKVNPLFTIKMKKNIKSSSEFNIKTLIAGAKGIKLESEFIPIVIN